MSALRAAPARAPGRCAHSALAQLRCVLEEELKGICAAGTWKSERVITSPQGPRIRVDGVSGGNSPSGSRWTRAAVEGASEACAERRSCARSRWPLFQPLCSCETWSNPFPRREVICP